MSPIFSQIRYIPCVTPHDGAVQMALDELLLEAAEGVVLRDYAWSRPTVSIGYFGKCADCDRGDSAKPPRDLVRRPTGGGLVEHGHGLDYTYSVIVSAAQVRAQELNPRSSYRAIHGILCQVLNDFGYPCRLAEAEQGGAGGAACFANPVGDDLMLDGKKIAGAGQKRCRGAVLHQGSIQPVRLPPGFGSAFAHALASRVEMSELKPSLLAKAAVLADEKYRLAAWNRRR